MLVKSRKLRAGALINTLSPKENVVKSQMSAEFGETPASIVIFLYSPSSIEPLRFIKKKELEIY